MEIERVPIVSLAPDPGNVRRHGKRNIEAIKASLARWGQQKPLVVDADGIVRAGNGTLEAARQLGWTDIMMDLDALGFSEAELAKLCCCEESIDTSPQLGGIEHRIIVICRDELHQRELIDRFIKEGLTCTALMS